MSEVTHSSEQYAYVDQTDPTAGHPGITAKGTSGIEETSQADSNPAYYPARNKSEGVLNEAEKAGAEFPGSGPAAASDTTTDEVEVEEVDDEQVERERAEAEAREAQERAEQEERDRAEAEAARVEAARVEAERVEAERVEAEREAREAQELAAAAGEPPAGPDENDRSQPGQQS